METTEITMATISLTVLFTGTILSPLPVLFYLILTATYGYDIVLVLKMKNRLKENNFTRIALLGTG